MREAAVGPAARGFRFPQDPFAELLDLGALPGRGGGDETAPFGRLGRLVEDGNQGSARVSVYAGRLDDLRVVQQNLASTTTSNQTELALDF